MHLSLRIDSDLYGGREHRGTSPKAYKGHVPQGIRGKSPKAYRGTAPKAYFRHTRAYWADLGILGNFLDFAGGARWGSSLGSKSTFDLNRRLVLPP